MTSSRSSWSTVAAMASLLFACKEQRSLADPAALPSTSAGAAQEVSSSAAIPDARIAKAIDESFARDPRSRLAACTCPCPAGR